jgi:hypothetical protein
MVQEQITFACGQILPGFGPINFPGDEPGNPPFVPGGEDPPVVPPPVVPPPVIPPDDPGTPVFPPDDPVTPPGPDPDPGTGTGGVIPDPPGPLPDPGNGGGPYCRCYVVGTGAPTTGSAGTGSLTYKQQCEKVIPPALPTPNSAAFEEAKANLEKGLAPGGAEIVSFTITPAANGSCESANNANECCEGEECCPDITITWILRPRDPGTITNDPGYPAPGGGLKNPPTSGRPPTTGTGAVSSEGFRPNKPPESGRLVEKPRKPLVEDIFRIVDNITPINPSGINLNDPGIISNFSSAPGLIDPDIGLEDVLPPGQVENIGNTDIFINPIESSLGYLLNNNNTSVDWITNAFTGLTVGNVINNIKPDVLDLLRDITNYDGTPLSDNQIFNILGSKIINGTINEFDLGELLALASNPNTEFTPPITPSTVPKINEIFSLNLIESNGIPLDSNKTQGRMSKIIPSWKVLPSDVDTHYPFEVSGECLPLYIRDNNCIVDMSAPLFMHDGDYVMFEVGDRCTNFLATTEKDHALLNREEIRQKALGLLGGNKSKVLSVTADLSSNKEFNYSLSTPRESFYLLSAVPDSVSSLPNNARSYLVKTHKVKYERASLTTVSGQDIFKYKANFGTFILHDEDVILDYLDSSSALYLQQDDILYNAPRSNKTIPILTRQIPPWIIVFPTNRQKYILFDTRSKITAINDGVVTRELSLVPSLNKTLSNPITTKFISYELAFPNTPNVYGEYDTETRITTLSPNLEVYQTAYEQNGELMPASQYVPQRRRTAFRLIKEIITELDTNYVLDYTSQGKGLNAFDIFSRMNLTEFNRFMLLENEPLLFPLIKDGLINGVKIFDPIKYSGLSALTKTRLLYKRENTPEDTFKQIKSLKGLEFSTDEEGNIVKIPYSRKPYSKR